MAKKQDVQVHVTSNGGVYVDADELMRSDAARKALEQAKRLSQSLLNARARESRQKEQQPD